jgi:hypothetical protein
MHTMRCLGAASAERLSTVSGIPSGETSRRLSHLADQGLVTLDSGLFGGWSLSRSGRARDEELVEEEMERTGARDRVHSCYESFLRLNPVFLQICTDFQLRRVGASHLVNDHSDPEYDAVVTSRLMDLDDSAQRVCEGLAGTLMRFDLYGSRLANALRRVLGGELGYVSETLESYHSIWFQLHEDLLATLGIAREGSS